MSFNRWKYLLPGFRRAAERDMQEEMDALAALADRATTSPNWGCRRLSGGPSPDDDRRAAPAHAAVLSYRYWQRAYGGARNAIGRGIRIQKIPFTIVGVAPREFFGLRVGDGADVWIPLSCSSPRFSQAATGSTAPTTISSTSLDGGRPAFVYPRRLRRSLLWRIGIALLLACFNVMGLQFARTDERRRERRSGFTACWRTKWRDAPARSAFARHSEPRGSASWGWYSAKSRCLRR